MRIIVRSFPYLVVVSLAFVLNPGRGQNASPADKPVVSATIGTKKPVFAGACKACPWGILAKVTADALKFYGYETTICEIRKPQCSQ